MIWIFLIFLGMIVYSALHYTVTAPEIQEQKNNRDKSEQEYIESTGIVITSKYEYANTLYADNISWSQGISYKFIVDGQNKKIHIFAKVERLTIPFSEIIGCEIFSDNQTVGGIKRAIVGGMLAGDTGALVGALTAKSHIMSYKIVIYRSNIRRPTTEILLLKGKTSTKSKGYASAVEFSQKVLASIKAIMHSNG